MKLEIPFSFHDSWYSSMVGMFNTDYMKQLQKSLKIQDYIPHRDLIFRVFNMPMDEIKVVILGQDPYPNPAYANGLAFAVNQHINKPMSLQFIEDEIKTSTCNLDYSIDRTLKSWADQGVFLLNCALTTAVHQKAAHMNYWWGFTQHVLTTIATHNTALVFMVWGKTWAYKHIKALPQEILENHLILYSAHPAAEYYKRNAGFLGCNHFVTAQQHYFKLNNYLINW